MLTFNRVVPSEYSVFTVRASTVATYPNEPDDLQLGCGNAWRTALDWSALLQGVVSNDLEAQAVLREYFRSGVRLYLYRETKVVDTEPHVDRCLDSLIACISLLNLRCMDDALPILRSIVRNAARTLIDTTVERAVSGALQVPDSPEP